MHVILSEERKIESRCQLEKLAIALIETQSEELETKQERRHVNDQWRAGRHFRNGLDPKLLSEKTKKRLNSRDVDWKRERKKRGEKGVEREDAKITRSVPKNRVWSTKQARLEPTPLNVTQAAVYKERWREQITHRKKKV